MEYIPGSRSTKNLPMLPPQVLFRSRSQVFPAVIRNLTRNPAVQKIHTRLTTFSNGPVSGFSGQVPHAARNGDVLRGAKELIVFPRMGCDENREPRPAIA